MCHQSAFLAYYQRRKASPFRVEAREKRNSMNKELKKRAFIISGLTLVSLLAAGYIYAFPRIAFYLGEGGGTLSGPLTNAFFVLYLFSAMLVAFLIVFSASLLISFVFAVLRRARFEPKNNPYTLSLMLGFSFGLSLCFSMSLYAELTGPHVSFADIFARHLVVTLIPCLIGFPLSVYVYKLRNSNSH